MLRNDNDLEYTIQANINLLNFLLGNKPKLLLVKLAFQHHQISLSHFLNKQ